MTRNVLRAAGVALLWASLVPVALAHGDDDHRAHGGHGTAKSEATPFGQPGEAKKASRTITIDMSDSMRFNPSALTVRRGETVKFVVRNGGRLLHEMVLGTPASLQAHAEMMRKSPQMEHAEAHIAHVKPGRNGELVWQFSQPGEFQFACLQPGHFEAGMVGTVTVQATAAEPPKAAAAK